MIAELAGLRVEGGSVRTVADQVIAVAILHRRAQGSVDIAIEEQAAGIVGQGCQAPARVGLLVGAGDGVDLPHSPRVRHRVTVSACWSGSLSPAGVDGVDDRRSAVGIVDQMAHAVQGALDWAIAVEQIQVFGKQDYGFAAGQFAQSLDHVTHRAQSSRGKDPGEADVGSGAGLSSVRGDRGEAADAGSAHRIELHQIDGRVQQALIGGELLQRAHTRAGADDGHQVARLHLLAHEFPERILNASHALGRKPEVIHHECDGAADLGRFQSGCAGADCRARGYIGEVANGLRLSVLQNAKVVGFEIGYRPAAAIGHDGIDLDQVDVNADDCVRSRQRGLWRALSIERRPCQRKHQTWRTRSC